MMRIVLDDGSSIVVRGEIEIYGGRDLRFIDREGVPRSVAISSVVVIGIA